jgi:hypothetical protein
MSMPDSMLRGAIAQILQREGETQSAAAQIRRILESEKRLVDLKVAPDELGVTPRTMYRWIKVGRLTVETIAGRRMVDVSKMSVREE